MSRRLFAAVASIVLATVCVYGQGRGGRGGPGGGPGAAPPSAQAAATNDLTGYWVRIVTEDWRWLMVVPPKGDVSSIGGAMGVLSPAGTAIPMHGIPPKMKPKAISARGMAQARSAVFPHVRTSHGRMRNTLKWETDQGMQTRLFTVWPGGTGSLNPILARDPGKESPSRHGNRRRAEDEVAGPGGGTRLVPWDLDRSRSPRRSSREHLLRMRDRPAAPAAGWCTRQ